MNKSKGFTIIELIVVIAIIAILAAIVMVNVTQYINKGKNAAIKGNLGTMQTNATIWYDQNSGTYVGFKASSGYTLPLASIHADNPSDATVEAESATAYCVSSTLNAITGDTNWCVDSTGFSGVPTATGTCGTNTACH